MSSRGRLQWLTNDENLNTCLTQSLNIDPLSAISDAYFLHYFFIDLRPDAAASRWHELTIRKSQDQSSELAIRKLKGFRWVNSKHLHVFQDPMKDLYQGHFQSIIRAMKERNEAVWNGTRSLALAWTSRARGPTSLGMRRQSKFMFGEAVSVTVHMVSFGRFVLQVG